MSSDEKLSKYSFWKSQYQSQMSSPGFDWFVGPGNVTSVIHHHVLELWTALRTSGKEVNYGVEAPSQLLYLELGCGTSLLPQDVLRTSQVPITAVLVDYVQEALVYQQQQFEEIVQGGKCGKCQSLAVCADVMSLPLRGEVFDLVVDKGTMDALIRDRQNGHANAEVLMSEALRILKKGGRYLQVSDEDPDVRIDFLDRLWRLGWLNQCSGKDCGSSVNPVEVTDDMLTSANSHTNGMQTSSYSDKCQSSVESKARPNLRDNQAISLDPSCVSDLDDTTFVESAPSGSWRFKVIPSEWGQEYFVYWRDK